MLNKWPKQVVVCGCRGNGKDTIEKCIVTYPDGTKEELVGREAEEMNYLGRCMVNVQKCASE